MKKKKNIVTTDKWYLIDDKETCLVYYFVLSDGKEGYYIEQK